MTHDPVNKPAHYTAGKIEVIDAIEDWHLDYHRGNAVKYIARAGKKDPAKTVQDIEKAIWYLKRFCEKQGEVMSELQWWGYTHINGSPQLKRYFSEQDIIEAKLSEMVMDTRGPVDAENREDAMRKLFPEKEEKNG